LVIFINGDFTLRENGSQIRMAEQIQFASEHFSDLAVYSHRWHPSHPWNDAAEQRFKNLFPAVELILESVPQGYRIATRLKNIALAIWPGCARRILRWSVPRLSPRYDLMRTNANKYLFWINFVDGCTVLNGLPFRTILETHDIRFVKHAKLSGKPTYSLRVLGKLRSELAIMKQLDATVAISPVDASVFGALVTGPRNFFIPSYAGVPARDRASQPASKHDLLFVGANNRFNVDGLTAFLTSNQHWLKQRSILVAGKVCEAPSLCNLANEWPNLTLLGFVEDLAPIYASASAIISPVDGTGLKIKVVEALAHGKPVLGSSHSRQALPWGYDDCVLPLDREHVERLLDDPSQLIRAEQAAISYYLKFVEDGDRVAFIAYLNEQLTSDDGVSD
jgi:glycosyltransferase involved in cell wall biosynthesis